MQKIYFLELRKAPYWLRCPAPQNALLALAPPFPTHLNKAWFFEMWGADGRASPSPSLYTGSISLETGNGLEYNTLHVTIVLEHWIETDLPSREQSSRRHNCSVSRSYTDFAAERIYNQPHSNPSNWGDML